MKTINSLKNISITTIANLTEAKINSIFKEARWEDKPTCLKCGSFSKYNIKNEKGQITRFKCCDCGSLYSITSNTIFDNHKLPLKTYLLAITLFVNSAKGISSLQLARDLAINEKVAFVMLHKIRMALFNQYEELNKNKLKGTIQIDGAYITHKIKKTNKKKDRVDGRLAENIDKQCIITMREIDENGLSKRSYAFIIRNENSIDIQYLVDRYIEKGSTIISDEHVSYKVIKKMDYETKTINHSEEYQNKEGTNTNQAESYFSRLRRMIIGQHHRLSKKYLELYVNEITYRENMRFYSNKEVLIDLLKHCMRCDNETIFNGYHQQKNCEIDSFKK